MNAWTDFCLAGVDFAAVHNKRTAYVAKVAASAQGCVERANTQDGSGRDRAFGFLSFRAIGSAAA
jgi:hypothetical protein